MVDGQDIIFQEFWCVGTGGKGSVAAVSAVVDGGTNAAAQAGDLIGVAAKGMLQTAGALAAATGAHTLMHIMSQTSFMLNLLFRRPGSGTYWI